jgi:transposase-like protein
MKRNRHSAELKAKVALEAIRGQKTVNEIASQYDVHPNQVGTWKKQVLESLPEIFSNGKAKSHEEEQAKLDALYQQIGQLQVELSFLKKRSGHLI